MGLAGAQANHLLRILLQEERDALVVSTMVPSSDNIGGSGGFVSTRGRGGGSGSPDRSRGMLTGFRCR
jgi:hypothetical protein